MEPLLMIASFKEKVLHRLAQTLLRLKTYAEKNIPFSREDTALLGIYLFVISLFTLLVHLWLNHESEKLSLGLMMGYKEKAFADNASYNISFVSYILIILTIICGFLCKWLFGYAPRLHSILVAASEKIWRRVFCLAVLLVFAFSRLSMHLSSLCMLAAVLLLGSRFLIDRIPSCKEDSPKREWLSFVIMMSLVVASLWLGAKAWYPVKISNDYIETTDKILLPEIGGGNKAPLLQISRPDMLDCLIAHNDSFVDEKQSGKYLLLAQDKKNIVTALSKNLGIAPQTVLRVLNDDNNKWAQEKVFPPECKYNIDLRQIDELQISLRETGDWQSQAGRTFYHHSYMFVPIAHFLRYGFDSPVPTLYGLGNTLLHTLLMMSRPLTLTNYFNTFPLTQLIGILAVVTVVFYVTRSLLAIPAAFALVLLPLWFLGFEGVQLAPGFNPSRYIGLALQVASIFCVFRGRSPLRILFLILSLGFSVFWNKEFALLGIFGQILALMSPQLQIRPLLRFTSLVALVGVAALSLVLLGNISHGFLETIQVGLYGISVSAAMMTFFQFTKFCVGVLFSVTILGWGVRCFKAKERAARWCLLSVLSLLMIKFLYNFSGPHILYTFSFIAPMTLLYWGWAYRDQPLIFFTGAQWKEITSSAVMMICLLCFVAALYYYRNAHGRDVRRIDPYVQYTWDGLGENFITPTPSDPIVSRMKAIQDEIKPNDNVLFLSPFDHLMSFYGNPEKYCGHFEVMTNLVTYKNLDDTADCIRQSPSMLVVYDEALENPCPTERHNPFYNDTACRGKKVLEIDVRSLMDTIRPGLVLVKTVGPLSFYRHDIH
jgi:hypothetical protein